MGDLAKRALHDLSLLFGFLPVALWWQALVSLLAAGLMALMVRFAWPFDLEDEALEAEHRRLAHDGGGGSAEERTT